MGPMNERVQVGGLGTTGWGPTRRKTWTPHRLPCCPHSLGADKPHFLQPASSIQRAVDTHNFGRRRPNKDGRGALSDLPLFNPGSAYGAQPAELEHLRWSNWRVAGCSLGTLRIGSMTVSLWVFPSPLKRPSFLLTLSLDSGRTLLSGLVGLDGRHGGETPTVVSRVGRGSADLLPHGFKSPHLLKLSRWRSSVDDDRQ